MPASERGSRLPVVIAALAIVQGVLGALRALELVSIGVDVAGRGVLLLPLIGSVLIARGILVAAIAALYTLFAWFAFRRNAWAWPIGMLVALVNSALVGVVLIGGGGAPGTVLWAIVPVVIIVYLLTPAGRRAFVISALFVALLGAAPASAQESQAELAKKLQNPVASLISVPFQSNWDFGNGPKDAMRYTLNVQPVVPFSLSKDWNLIIRTIVPFVHAEATVSGGDSHGGIGDIVQSFFFSPGEPLAGWIVGAGPVLLYPSASDPALGGEKWGAGPTAVVLRQDSGWTYGLLANHIESFAGSSSRDRVSATFMQPFLTYTTKTFTTFGVNIESTYDWEHEQWTVPINASVSQLLKIGGQPVQLSLGGRYFAERPIGGPDWGIRFTVTFLFPK